MALGTTPTPPATALCSTPQCRLQPRRKNVRGTHRFKSPPFARPLRSRPPRSRQGALQMVAICSAVNRPEPAHVCTAVTCVRGWSRHRAARCTGPRSRPGARSGPATCRQLPASPPGTGSCRCHASGWSPESHGSPWPRPAVRGRWVQSEGQFVSLRPRAAVGSSGLVDAATTDAMRAG